MGVSGWIAGSPPLCFLSFVPGGLMQTLNKENLYGKIFNATVVAIGITDLDGYYTVVNPAWSQCLGYSAEEAKQITVSDVTPAEDRASSALNYQRLIERKVSAMRISRRYLCKDGSTIWADLSVSALTDEDDNVIGLLGVFVNIDPQIKAETNLQELNEQLTASNIELQLAMEKLTKLARHDPLTHLYNRRVLEEVMQHEIQRSIRNQRGLGVAIADIDNFKMINDTYGHDFGDVVLVRLAKVLRKRVRTTDIVGRWGGEEFLFVFPETSRKGAMIVVERIRVAVEKISLRHHGKQIRFTMSLGLSFHDLNPNRALIVNEADQALYRAKRDGKNLAYCFQDLPE
jgi:diguanylate cyclase (GGDEF)-like protein/PAS domain S-box-containing protein